MAPSLVRELSSQESTGPKIPGQVKGLANAVIACCNSFVESLSEELEEAHRGKNETLRLTKLQLELDRALIAAREDLPTVDWM